MVMDLRSWTYGRGYGRGHSRGYGYGYGYGHMGMAIRYQSERWASKLGPCKLGPCLTNAHKLVMLQSVAYRSRDVRVGIVEGREGRAMQLERFATLLFVAESASEGIRILVDGSGGKCESKLETMKVPSASETSPIAPRCT